MADTSENTEVQDSEQVTTPQAGDLGKQLKRCREKAGLDIEQAASEIRLSPHLLRSLEEEDFQTLPEPPYVRGYLRSYAKLSDSNPNALIETYEVLRGGNNDYTTQFTPLQSIEYVAKPRLSSFTAKLIGLLLLIAVLGGLSMMPDVRAWANNLWTSFSEKVEGTATDATTSDDETGNTTESTETSVSNDTDNSADDTTTNAISIPRITNTTDADATVTDAESTQASADTGDDKLAGTIQRDADEATSDDATTTTSSDENTDGAETTATPESDAANASDTTDEQSDSTSENSSADAEDKNTDDTAENNEENETRAENNAENDVNNDAENSDGVDTTKQPIDGKVTIRMDFEQEVWLEIRNNEDKAIFETLKSSGRQELQAHTPLTFKVGNAPGVKIYLNGVLFDQKPHTRGNVAKFEVK